MRIALAALLLRYKFQLKSHALYTMEGFMHKPISLELKLERQSD